MRQFARVPAVLLALVAMCTAANAQARLQDDFIPAPENVKAEGVPPIPASLAPALAPYSAFRRAMFVAWHPTRREMVVATTFGNVPQFHLVAGPGMDRQQITFFPEGLSSSSTAAYSPDGATLIITKDAAGAASAEAVQLYRYDIKTRQSTLLTDGKSQSLSFEWSHRGGRVAFDSTQRTGRDRDLYVMDALNPSTARRILEVQGRWTVADWSPDDRQLLVINAPAGASRTFLWLIDVHTGEKKSLTPLNEEIVWRRPQFSSDGRYIYALSNKNSELNRVWRCTVASGEWEPLGPPDEMIENMSLSPDGRTLAVVVFAPTGSRLELRDARTMAVRATPKLPNGQMFESLLWRPDSSEVAFTFWSPSMYGDVFSVHAKSGAVERWTRSESSFNPETLPEPEIVKWKSFDGLEFSGVLYRPRAGFTGPRPVVISIHGGPSGTSAIERPRFQGRSQYFLNELGIALIYPNIRGSYGFGKTFARLDDRLKREDSVKDIGAVLDWIAADPSLDENRVMVTGISYGGYMAYAVAEMFPGRVRCAVSANGISDFITYFEYTNEARVEDRRIEYGDERDPATREFLTRISPVAQASQLKAPMLIVHGARDPRVPPQQGAEMARALRAGGTPVWHLVFGNEDHFLWRSSSNNNYFFYVQTQFIQQYLLN